jgi:hypothetical protein
MSAVRFAWCAASMAVTAVMLSACGSPAPPPASKVEFSSTKQVKTGVPMGGTTAKGIAPTEAFAAPPGVKTGDYRGGLR